ncbi:MAG: sodium:proton antiporter [Clostridia bacterium]|nr:sodium:proton antiporter [Clostridia bacterium]
MLSICSAAFTSVMPRKIARGFCLTVITAIIVMSALLVSRMYGTRESYTFMMGHFPAPWGNEIRVGRLEALTALVFSIIMALSVLGGLMRIEEHVFEDKQPLYYVMIELLMAALLAEVYTNDLFTAYVFVEIMTLTACSLIMARSKGRTIVAATRYMIWNLMGSGLFLLGLTFLYGMTGHLLMSHIREQVDLIAAAGTYPRALTITIALMCVGLAIKSGLFPFHTWLPDCYGYSTPTSSAILSSLVSKGYIFLIVKIIYRVIGMETVAASGVTNVFFAMGLSGIIMGSVSAIREKDIRRMISFSSVAQIGYVFMGIGMASEAGMVASLFHVYVHGISKSMLFLAGNGLIEASSDSKLFRDLRGSGRRNPIAGLAFTVGSFSLVGIPFLGGFVSKVYFAKAAMSLNTAPMLSVLIVLAISAVLNTVYFIKTVITIYRVPMPEDPVHEPVKHRLGLENAALICLICVNFALGVMSQPVVEGIRAGLNMFA